jgi:hypothetical protein
VAEYALTFGFCIVEVGGLGGGMVGVLFSGGQQTIGVDPSNEHSCGIIFFLIPSNATGQFPIFRQMESGDFPLPLRQISPIYE